MRRPLDTVAMISIHALREEGDMFRYMWSGMMQDFYPRPPRGGRPGLGDKWFQDHQISIHALREEGDHLVHIDETASRDISIHALREEGDSVTAEVGVIQSNFYPRPPRGGRHAMIWQEWFRDQFLSTPSARRATSGWRP